jgi:endonuclease III
MDTIMPATTNKQKVLNQILTTLKKRYEPAETPPRPVLEQFLYAVCREGAPRALADRAYENLRERFFDWNELRVSSAREVEDALEGLPEAEVRANRLISILQEVFETTFSFELEGLHKKGLKQAAKQLSRYQASSDYAVAWVVQQALGGHAIPLDEPALRALRRLGLVDEVSGDLEALRAGLEHLVPKARAIQFSEILSALAFDVCLDDDPVCKSCPMASECPSAHLATVASGERSSRSRK